MEPKRHKKLTGKQLLGIALTVFISVPVLIYVCNCPFLAAPMVNFVLFHPIRHPIDQPYENEGTHKLINGHDYVDVFFPAQGGEKLHGWYIDVPKAKYVVLLCHGNGGNLSHRRDVMQLLVASGCSVLAFDYRGYGRSEGTPSIDNVCDDAMSAYSYLCNEKQLAPERIIIFGESLGSSIGGNLSHKVKCAGVILQSPIASVQRRAIELFDFLKIYPSTLWPQGGLNNLKLFQDKHAPLLLIGGTKDRNIPVAHGDDLFKSASQPKFYERIEGAGHTGDPLLMKSPLYTKALNDFVARLDSSK